MQPTYSGTRSENLDRLSPTELKQGYLDSRTLSELMKRNECGSPKFQLTRSGSVGSRLEFIDELEV
jgi:hypothetical protein